MISEEQHHKVKYDFSIYGLLLLYAILLFFYVFRPSWVWKDKGSDWNWKEKKNELQDKKFVSRNIFMLYDFFDILNIGRKKSELDETEKKL